MTYDQIRLSKHFVLLDFMADHDLYTYGRPLDRDTIVKPEHIANATRLCQSLLEPMMELYGPISVAGGFWPGIVRTTHGHHQQSPHKWLDATGAAADVVFHDWVNAERAPIDLLFDLDKTDITYDRAIQYAGSEFVCLNVRGKNNRAALYENRWDSTSDAFKGKYINHGSTPKDRKSRAGMKRPITENWRRIEGGKVPHTRGRLRAHHIRTGQYFVLLDFCRSSAAISKGMSSVPPIDRVKPQIRYARMFSEVLDPCVKKFGRVTVLRGLEPKGLFSDDNAPMHRWLSSLADGLARCVVLLPQGVDSEDWMDELEKHEAVRDMEAFEHITEAHAVAFVIQEFDPTVIWSSGHPK
jgi:hypothetical protein